MTFDFGIPGYQPQWLNGLQAIKTAHGQRLHALVGRSLRTTAVAWEYNDDAWFADDPVVLDFHGEQIEINHQKFDDLSITWNTIDLTAAIGWPTGDDFQLSWRLDSPAELTALHGQILQRVELLEYVADDMAKGMTAVGFTFAVGYLRIHNALDENGLAFTPSTAYQPHPPAD